MLKVENQCVDCGLPCLGSSCSYRNVEVYYCDRCGNECGDEVYDVDGTDLCEYCLKDQFRKELD